jgi:hypothetical protein
MALNEAQTAAGGPTLANVQGEIARLATRYAELDASGNGILSFKELGGANDENERSAMKRIVDIALAMTATPEGNEYYWDKPGFYA